MEKANWAIRLLKALYLTVKNNGGLRAMAKFLGKGYSTLHAELNANEDPKGNRTHKLGWLDWVRIMRRTRDFGTLHMVAALCGFVAIQFEDHDSSDLCWLTYQAKHAHAHSNAGLALLDLLREKGRLTQERRTKLIKEFYNSARESMNIAHALESYDGDGGLVQQAA